MTRQQLLTFLFDCHELAIKNHDSKATAKISYLIADLIDIEYRR